VQAKVIDVTDRTIYLEIEDQLRFRSGYQICKPGRRLAPLDEVEFDFDIRNRDGAVVINAILAHPSGRVGRRNSTLP